MMDWPTGDVEAVYMPPAEPPEVLLPKVLRARLAGARVREGLSAADHELDEVLARDPSATQLLDLRSIYTRAEQDELDRPLDLSTRARRLLDLGEDEDGLLEMGWRDGRKIIIVHIAERFEHFRARLEDELLDRVVVVPAAFSEGELRRISRRVMDQYDELLDLGIDVQSVGVGPARVHVEYAAAEPTAAAGILQERFGEALLLEWHGPSISQTFRPFPFGSWLAEEDRLTVFYALHHNGERPGSCDAYETDREVIVSLRIVDWRGAKTLVGGFTPSHATVQLSRPVGRRTVIDDATHRPRPHWSDV